MPVTETNVVDAIGVDRITGRVVLTIKDPLEWTGEHVLLLQEKLNAYLRFVESGELNQTYPDSVNRAVSINILMKHEPNEMGREFLQRAVAVLEEAGFTLNWQVLGNEDQALE